MQVVIFDRVGLRNSLEHSFSNDHRIFPLAGVGEKDDKFVATLAADSIGAANAAD
jgi:hypothetical protein